MTLREDSQQLLRPPGGMMPSHLDDRRHEIVGRLVRTTLRSSRLIRQARRPAVLVSIDPFVGGLAADAEAVRELRDREHVALVVRDELHALVHEQPLLPRHRAPRLESGLMCYPCTRTDLLPFSPDRTAAHSN